MNLGDAARRYAEAGIPVFPLVAGGKAPLTARGLYAATTDLYEIQAWWARNPNANIGMPTGEASNWDVLDIDVPKDNVEGHRQRRTGWEVVKPALEGGLLKQPALIIETPSGGAHLYYAAREGARNGSMSDYGLDFRAEGGYVVVPPSRTQAGEYKITQGLIPAHRHHQCDFTKLRELIQRADEPQRHAAQRRAAQALHAQPKSPETVGRRADALARTVAEAKVGTRNNVLYWAARVSIEDDLQCLDKLYLAGKASGLEADEASRTIQSALRGRSGEPRIEQPRRSGPSLAL